MYYLNAEMFCIHAFNKQVIMKIWRRDKFLDVNLTVVTIIYVSTCKEFYTKGTFDVNKSLIMKITK